MIPKSFCFQSITAISINSFDLSSMLCVREVAKSSLECLVSEPLELAFQSHAETASNFSKTISNLYNQRF